MTPRHRHEFDQLVSAFCDDSISDAEFAQLERLIREQDSCRQRYLELMALHGSLAWSLAALGRPDETLTLRLRRPIRRWRRWLAWSVLAAALLVGAMIVRMPARSAANDLTPTIAAVTAGCEILSPDGPPEAAVAGLAVPMGRSLRTSENGSVALVYPNGTRLEMGPETTARINPNESDREVIKVTLSLGSVKVLSTESTKSSPIVLTTPHAEIRFLASVLTCMVADAATRVDLERGQAEMVRQADGKPLQLTEGGFAISGNTPDDRFQPLRIIEQVTIPRLLTRDSRDIRLTPDASQLILARQNELLFWNTRTGTQKASWKLNKKSSIRTFALAPNGQTLYVGMADDLLTAYSMTTRQPLWSVAVALTQLACSPDGRLVAGTDNSSQTGEVYLFQTADGRSAGQFQVAKGAVGPLTFSPDSRWLAAGSRNSGLLIWDLASSKTHAVLKGTRRPVDRCDTLAFSPDRRWLAGEMASDKAIKVWSTESLTEQHRLQSYNHSIRSLAFSPDGRYLVLGSITGVLRCVDLASGVERFNHRIDIRGVRWLGFTPDGSQLIVVTLSGLIQHWNMTTLQESEAPT